MTCNLNFPKCTNVYLEVFSFQATCSKSKNSIIYNTIRKNLIILNNNNYYILQYLKKNEKKTNRFCTLTFLIAKSKLSCIRSAYKIGVLSYSTKAFCISISVNLWLKRILFTCKKIIKNSIAWNDSHYLLSVLVYYLFP